MNRRIRKALATLFACLLTAGLVPVAAFAEGSAADVAQSASASAIDRASDQGFEGEDAAEDGAASDSGTPATAPAPSDSAADSSLQDGEEEDDADEVSAFASARAIDGPAAQVEGSTWGNAGNNTYWVVAGKSFTISGYSGAKVTTFEYGSAADPVTATNGNNSVTISANGSVQNRAVANVTLTGNQEKTVTVIVLPRTVEAKVYLRYSNEIPNLITMSGDAADYGPAGDNTPYFVATVDLASLLNSGEVGPYIVYRNGAYQVYLSIDGRSSATGDRKELAKGYWDSKIRPFIAPDDQQKFIDMFGDGIYFGYVLKVEGDGWHIDGALTNDPPNYVVELYKNDEVKFTVSKSGGKVDFGDFDRKLKDYLGLSSEDALTYESAGEKSVRVTYTKDGITYQTTISPLGKVSGDPSAIHYADGAGSFEYREMSTNTYYLCQLKIDEPTVVSGALSVTKVVAGNVGNAEQHFSFRLMCDGDELKGKNFSATYANTDSDGSAGSDDHPTSIEFGSTGVSNTFKLKHNETITIAGLPAGVQVRVVETDARGSAYADVTAEVSAQNGKDLPIKVASSTDPSDESDGGADSSTMTATLDPVEVLAGETVSVTVTNTANAAPNAALNMEVAPFAGMLALGLAAAGAGAMRMRRRVRLCGSSNDAWKE